MQTKFTSLKKIKSRKYFHINSLGAILFSLAVNLSPWFSAKVQAQTDIYCKLPPEAIASKENLRQAVLEGNKNAEKQYQDILIKHNREVGNCRMRNWPRTQGIWLRLYPCDARPGEIDRILDKIVNQGYNQVYIEAFYDGQVLLPAANNPTVWPSILRVPGYENVDLLADSLKKAKERGLRAYAWVFTMNFGYTYSQLPNRQQALARNGRGQTTLDVIPDNVSLQNQLGASHAFHTFIDPYSPQARQDYNVMVNEVLKRQPQGVLFDYIRYLRGMGSDSVADQVKDLWIYSEASQNVLLQRAKNEAGKELIRKFVDKGYVTSQEINGRTPKWQRFFSPSINSRLTERGLETQIWELSVAHAAQGILDFLQVASQPVQEKGLPAGAVFFPGGNRRIQSNGFDSRLQPWDQFPTSMEWHPMAYATCGDLDPSCIVSKVERVMSMTPKGVKVIPAIAGAWGEPLKNRPSLEIQMQAIKVATPQINSISHFSYGWQNIEETRERKHCRLSTGN
ncbi:conserved hypothetical protein [Trichodesmium erythraeum IMS101]|uniref:Glycosyl hydrolase-like 10 domain-containing protein n=1 Tax=Trichodesmium erythraeum (strain IMS101) TaxID=203124 RepID=Q114S3_TRIEI|nr:hypothetical protein [Trichodesmium sp. ALOHA_ZT_67]MDT9339615.1 hypothetical protein [Trichodesmium erythraeum 21-75]